MVTDVYQRSLRDLRISVTDRCNFRCGYCMPREVFDKDFCYLPHSSILSFEEITRLTTIFIKLGVEKIRITGGEPLIRKDLEHLIGQLSLLNTQEGKPLDLALTTNGSLLSRKADVLKQAGLKRLTVSLDALDDTVFRKMTDTKLSSADVIQGIETAQQLGFDSIKVNMVVRRGLNEDQIIPMAKRFVGTGIILRFIEYMDVGTTNGWRMDEVVPSREILKRLQRVFPLKPLAPNRPGETAQRWGLVGGQGELGFISSVTQAFCGSCNRTRLSTEGKLYLCLFAGQGYDIRSLLRSGASSQAIEADLVRIWQGRKDRYSQLRSRGQAPPTRKIEMSYIGG